MDAIFDRLVGYAADHDHRVSPGERRVFLEEADYKVLVGSKLAAHFPIGRRQAAVLIQTDSRDILAIAGFEAEDIRSLTHIREIECLPGIAVAAIADLGIAPSAGPVEVLNVVGASSGNETGYQGHELEKVLALFPSLRFLEIDAEVKGTGNFVANLLTGCAAEGAYGNGWINDELACELVRLAEQRIAAFPYEFVVRATLELEPKNLFLALYRCLEATYAFTRASELALKLGVNDRSWFDVARVLGDSLSWYPRHDQSLAAVLSLPAVSQGDLDALAASLGKDPGGGEVATRVAGGIRELRNSLVHYGPTTRPAAVPDDDWNRLCTPLARVVGSVFAHTYGGVGAGPQLADRAVGALNPAKSSSPPRRSPISRCVEGVLQLARGRR